MKIILRILHLTLLEAWNGFCVFPRLLIGHARAFSHDWRHFFNIEEMAKHREIIWTEKPVGRLYPFTVCMMCECGRFHYVRDGYEAQVYMWREGMADNRRRGRPWWASASFFRHERKA